MNVIPKVGVINYGGGNTQSVCNALQHQKIDYVLSASPELLTECSHLILPGVGSYQHCMMALEQSNLVDFLSNEVLHKKKFFLGICVGMQLLTEVGYEFGSYRGLGWIRGSCQKINVEASGLLLPHVGWNEVAEGGGDIELFKHLERPTFYFVHSFAVQIDEPVKVALTDYGGNFVAAVQKENIFGVQFHPEKSQKHGLAILKNFCELS